ncbi:MAG: hypothetical protein KGI19_10675 [Thaumarchaeota archaeon]|nr:hypothetical protein [Nitrososphaerota archaeon]
MTDLKIKGEYDGAAGEFQLRTSFPTILKPCNTVVDKITKRKEVVYVKIHGEKNGSSEVIRSKIKTDLI